MTWVFAPVNPLRMDPVQGNPIERLLCRTNLWHAWRLHHSPEGGGRFERCARCGKERDTPTATFGVG
jgi:hypothetical protein